MKIIITQITSARPKFRKGLLITSAPVKVPINVILLSGLSLIQVEIIGLSIAQTKLYIN